MQRRQLGRTELDLPILSFGASSLGAEFRNVTLDEVFASVRVARTRDELHRYLAILRTRHERSTSGCRSARCAAR